jgi:thymidylate kinase
MRAGQFPQRIRVIDARQPVDAVKAAVEQLLTNLFATGSA